MLRAILDGDAGTPADIFVIGALVGVLKAPPTADVIDEHQGEIGAPGLHVFDELPERVAPLYLEATFPGVGIGPDDLYSAGLSILLDRFGLVFGRVFLMVRRHADVFGSPKRAVRLS